jgi:hypothetical protein
MRRIPSLSTLVYSRAPVGQYWAHRGSPLHRSHRTAMRCGQSKKVAPTGQEYTQALQPRHFSASVILAPVAASFRIALVGHVSSQRAFSQCIQVMGTFSIEPSSSVKSTRIRDRSGLHSWVWFVEQTISHIRHPEHLSASIVITYCTLPLLLRPPSKSITRHGFLLKLLDWAPAVNARFSSPSFAELSPS